MQGDERVLRGGCWYYHPGACRPAERGYHVPEVQSNGIGFRVAADQEEGPAGQWSGKASCRGGQAGRRSWRSRQLAEPPDTHATVTNSCL
jgi:Sulfatase-modifying factor enzyme 1